MVMKECLSAGKELIFLQITNISFFYNRFSTLTNESKKSMERIKIHLILEDNTWSAQRTVPKNNQNRFLSTEWNLIIANFTVEN